MEATAQNALPVGTVLMEYRLTRVLGAGTFGVTYLARDLNLDKDVAIKEFAPGGIVVRSADHDVAPASAEQAELFRWGLQRFIQESRTLAALSHPSIVRVNRYFEAHGTAYMVMDYEHGETFKAFVQRRGRIAEPELKSLFAPLLDGLERVHAAGYLHRDIKPDNLLVRHSGELVLIDFGSARRAIPGASQGLTALVSPGYAPFEQYSEGHEQGPWSDLYALGGVLFFAVTGQRPADSLARMKTDTVPAGLQDARRSYTSPFIDAIAWALTWDDARRPRSVQAWRAALLAGTDAANAGASGGAAAQEATIRIRSSPAARAEATVRIDAATNAPADAVPTASGPQAVAARPQTDRANGSLRNSNWTWIAGYLIVAGGAALLGIGLASTELFDTTPIVRSRSWIQEILDRPGRAALTAAQVAKAAGYVCATAVLWALTRRAAAQLGGGTGGSPWWPRLLLPAATLIAVACAYAALLPVTQALPQSAVTAAFNWAFIIASAAAGAWLVLTISKGFGEWLGPRGQRPERPARASVAEDGKSSVD